MIDVTVVLYANLRVKAGVNSVRLSMPDNATVDDMLTNLKQQFPPLIPHLTEKIVISINKKIALRGDLLPDGAEVALLPPIGGGR
ncbi:MAG TPA: MoaD/ThiS family protein [Chloroflexi bacterium]|nr:MoaD/ThiS family protein [Chloroflexota bacterium]